MMRRILMATAVAAGLMAAAAPAWAVGSDDDELAPVGTAPARFKLNRYVFDTMGRSAGEMTSLGCLGGRQGIVRSQHTKGDVAAAVFTAGFYTPVHVTVECPTSVSP